MALRQPLALYRALGCSGGAAGAHGSLADVRLVLQLQLRCSPDALGLGAASTSPRSLHDQAYSSPTHATAWLAGVQSQQRCANQTVRMGVPFPHGLLLFSGAASSRNLAAPPLAVFFSSSSNKRTVHGTGSAGQEKPGKPAPDAEACDEALEDYQALKSRFDQLQRPSTLRPWHQVVVDTAKTIGNGSVAVVRYMLTIPQKIQEFRRMPKEDWQRWKTKAWETVKHEAHHYWVGTKLLWFEVKISSRLAIKAARGKELSRRERQQLARTTADLFRLVPMVVILVIPFLEFLLPVLLRIFPNMLPSTYEDKLKKEEELKRRLSIKLELARFLQDTVAEMAKDITRRKGSGSAKELYEFIKKVRSGEPVENSEILRFAQLFNDELTLDNLERVQLVSMCQFVGIAPFGTDSFLRTRLRTHLQQIKQDDYAIEQEGLENLTEEELRAACRSRGMRGPFGEGAVPFMRRQLQDWLDLSLHRGLPSSLLLLSRAFTITANVRDVAQKKDLAYEKVKETLSVIPGEVLDKVGYEALGGQTSVQALEKKLELLKREEALIKEELARAAVTQAKKAASAVKAGAAAVAAAAASTQRQVTEAVSGTLSPDVTSKSMAATQEELLADSISEEEKQQVSADERQRRLHKALQALLDLAAAGGVAKERTLFMDLIKTETERLNSDLAKSAKPTGGNLVFSNRGMEIGSGSAGGAADAHSGESGEDGEMGGAPKQLADRVSRMLSSIEKELDKVELSIGKSMHILDTDNDGIISQEELQHAVRFLREQLSPEELQQLTDQLRDAAAKGEGTPGSIPLANLVKLAARNPELGDIGAQNEVVKIHMK